MPLPSSPFDAEVSVFGWPWHGLMEGDARGTPGGQSHVILPSGKRLPCAAAYAHNTHLWDIGLPPPEIASDDPDEQWLGRAIIRSLYNGDDRVGAWAYGGKGYGEEYPMHVPGHGVMRRALVVTNQNTGVFVALLMAGRPPVLVEFSRAQLGLPAVIVAQGVTISAIRAQALDISRNGRSTLYAMCPRVQAINEIATLSRSIVEVTIEGEPVDGFTLSVRVVAPYGVVTSASAYPLFSDRPDFTKVAWRDGDTEIVVPMSQGAPTENSVFVGAWPEGVQRAATSVETPIWAWYRSDGTVEVVRYRREVNIQVTWSGSMSPVRQRAVGASTFTVSLVSGQNTASMATVFSTVRSGSENTWTETESQTIAGNHVNSQSGSAPWEGGFDGPPYPSVPPGTDPHPVIVDNSNPTDIVILSNKIIAPAAKDVRVEGADSTEYWCGNALTPAGIDVGLYRYRRNDPAAGSLGAFVIGAYNPITGQVVRNRTDKYCSWV